MMQRVLIASVAFVTVGVVAQAGPYMRYPHRKVRRGTGYSTPFAFDFGKPKSTVRTGFKPVTAQTSLADGAAFGWRDPKPVKAYYTRDDYKWKSFPVDILYCPYKALALSDLVDDALWGTQKAVFHVRVPAGRHQVYYIGGVPKQGGFPGTEYFKFDVAFNGKKADTVCIPFSTMFENRRWTVDVADQGLDIAFTPRTRWLVCGLIVYPARACKDVEERLIGPLEEDVYLMPPYAAEQGMRTLQRVAHEEPRQMPAIAPEQRKKGYVTFVRDWVDRVFLNTAPTASEIGRSVDLFATPGEWEPACVTVRALGRPCRIAAVRVGPLKRKDGRTLTPDPMRVYRVQHAWLALGTGRGYSAGRAIQGKVAPYLLEPDLAADVPADANQSYWLNLRIPADAASGVYEGAVRVEPADGPPTDVPMRVRVLPFVLQTRPDFVYGVYWSPVWNVLKRRHRDPVMREEAARREADELRDFREHDVETFTFGGFTSWKIDLENKRVAPVDPTFPGMAEAVRVWKRAGCTGPIISTPVKVLYHQLARTLMKHARPEGMAYGQQWHRKDTEIPQLVLDLMTQGAEIVQTHIKKMGYPEFLYYILDESDPKLMRKLYAAVKKAPGARTYSTSGNHAEDIGPWLDVNCSTGSFLARGDWKGEVRERAERGEFEPWAYPNSCLMGYHGSPRRCRYVYGFYAWKMGLRGLCPWIYTTNNGKGNPFNDFDRDYPDTGFVMPGPDGVILTTRWDGAREGIDDMRYLHTLTTLIAKAKRSADAKARTAAAEAHKALAAMKGDVPETYTGDEPDLWTSHNAQAYRWWLATRIMDLQAAMGASK